MHLISSGESVEVLANGGNLVARPCKLRKINRHFCISKAPGGAEQGAQRLL